MASYLEAQYNSYRAYGLLRIQTPASYRQRLAQSPDSGELRYPKPEPRRHVLKPLTVDSSTSFTLGMEIGRHARGMPWDKWMEATEKTTDLLQDLGESDIAYHHRMISSADRILGELSAAQSRFVYDAGHARAWLVDWSAESRLVLMPSPSGSCFPVNDESIPWNPLF